MTGIILTSRFSIPIYQSHMRTNILYCGRTQSSHKKICSVYLIFVITLYSNTLKSTSVWSCLQVKSIFAQSIPRLSPIFLASPLENCIWVCFVFDPSVVFTCRWWMPLYGIKFLTSSLILQNNTWILKHAVIIQLLVLLSNLRIDKRYK